MLLSTYRLDSFLYYNYKRSTIQEVIHERLEIHINKFRKNISSSTILTNFLNEISCFCAGSIHLGDGPCIPITVHRLQLPQGLRMVDRNARRHVLLPLLQFLQRNLQQEPSKEGGQSSCSQSSRK